MEVSAVAPWFGSNRMLADYVGRELAGCNWVGVVFAGGMSELAKIDARTLQVNDLHEHVIELARVMSDHLLGPMLYRALRRIPFHPTALKTAQAACLDIELCQELAISRADREQGVRLSALIPVGDRARLERAINYFVAAWMPRHSTSGTKGEFSVGISTRWSATGGDSAKHYANAIRSINAWRRVLARANFSVLHFREFLGKCKDSLGHGLYVDPPFPGAGKAYRHTFSEVGHRELAALLNAYEQTRVVCRFYDDALIRTLYPEPIWSWIPLVGRKQTNAAAFEYLVVNGPERPRLDNAASNTEGAD